MMAYKPPPELKNRIENIKKKFEVYEHSISTANPGNVQISSKDNDNHIQSNCQRVETKWEHGNDIFKSKNESSIEAGNNVKTKLEKVRSSGSSSGKGNIRRSPAFRCEKMALPHQPSAANKMSSVVNNRVKMFETKQQSISNLTPCNNYRKDSLLEENSVEQRIENMGDVSVLKCDIAKFSFLNTRQEILKPHTNFNQTSSSQLRLDSGFSYDIEDKSKSPPISRFGRNTAQNEHSGILRDNNVLYKDMSGKASGDKGKFLSGDSPGKTSNSLKAVLQAPLPPGPPPKKPPRTFVHRSPDVSVRKEMSLQNRYGKSDRINFGNSSEKPLLNSNKSVEPHLMLEKLESVLHKHKYGIGNVVIKPRTLPSESRFVKEDIILEEDLGNDINKKCEPSLKFSLLQTAKEPKRELKTSNNFRGGCLESLNCVSSSHLYEKLNEKQSEFFVDSLVESVEEKNKELEKSSECSDSRNNTNTKVVAKEHIYVEPYACIDVETILRTEMSEAKKKSLKDSLESFDKGEGKTPSNLHYMCSPINALDRIDALLNGGHLNSFKTNTNDLNSQDLLFEEKKNADCDILHTKYEDKPFAQKSFLHFPSFSKNQQINPVSLTAHKLDKNKVHLFMNQAFGSPLHGSPVTPLDSISSDESLATTPDEMNSAVDENEGSEEQKTREEDEMFTHGSESSAENLFDKHKEMSKLTEERKVYVRRVSSRVFSTRQRLPSRPFNHLYHCIMLIGLNLDGEKKTKIPYIKSKYPPNAVVPPLIEHLCFPDAADWPPVHNLGNHIDEQSYSLVITNEVGDHMYGYCRRVMPEGTDICLPLAYCILSPVRAKGFYFKILADLESQHGQPEWCQKAFIKELYACEFPNPGQSLKLSSTIKDVPGCVEKLLVSLSTQLRRPLDSRLEEHDLTLIFSTLTVPILIQVFACLLLERKVLFISNSLSKLSSCIEGLHSILYPFSWQYTFIPVLPSTQIGVCEAPTPFVIGLLKDKEGKNPSISLEEGIVVELEQPKILQCMGDESTILPPRLKKCLKMALQLVENATEQSEPARNVLISEAFIRMFVEMCGHYSNHIVMQQDGKKVFERESFIKSVASQSVQLFLEWFTETAMFSTFIESRLEEGTDNKGLFEQRALEHSEEMDKNTMLFLRNYKAINKKVKSFGDRLKDWTPFT